MVVDASSGEALGLEIIASAESDERKRLISKVAKAVGAKVLLSLDGTNNYQGLIGWGIKECYRTYGAASKMSRD